MAVVRAPEGVWWRAVLERGDRLVQERQRAVVRPGMMLDSRPRRCVQQPASATLLTFVALAVTLPRWVLIGNRIGG